MAAILAPAAQRINASVAGLTGTAPAPPPAHSVSPTEVADLIPTEFGGLTHLFGGEAVPTSTQYAPVNTTLDNPPGNVRGPLGGVVPDVRAAIHSGQTAVTSGAILSPGVNVRQPGVPQQISTGPVIGGYNPGALGRLWRSVFPGGPVPGGLNPGGVMRGPEGIPVPGGVPKSWTGGGGFGVGGAPSNRPLPGWLVTLRRRFPNAFPGFG